MDVIINISLKDFNIHTDLRKSFRGIQITGKWKCCVRNYRLETRSTKQRAAYICCDFIESDVIRKIPLLICAITDTPTIQSVETLRWKELSITSLDNFILRIVDEDMNKVNVDQGKGSFVTLGFRKYAA